MTSVEDFPEEQMVPPVIVNTPERRQGDIITFDQSRDTDLRLTFTVSDQNVDQELRIRARLTSLGDPMPQHVCPPDPIFVSGEARRPVELPLTPTLLRPGACTMVEVFVSSRFAGRCDRPEDLRDFDKPYYADDLATGLYWIWEMSRDPAANPDAARDIITSCQTVPRASTTDSPTPP